MTGIQLSRRTRPNLRARLLELDGLLPPLLRPLFRAYLLGYASAVAPRVLTLILQYLSRRKTVKGDAAKTSFFYSLSQILRKGFDPQRFPTFCAALVGGSTILQVPIRELIGRFATQLSELGKARLARWLSSFIAAWLSLQLLHSKQTPSFTQPTYDRTGGDGAPKRPVQYAGRTLDLTLFAVVRAVDVAAGALWSARLSKRRPGRTWSNLDFWIARLTDPAIFAVSSALIMWTWFYRPARLPLAYNRWITSAAAVDGRLIEALRRIRSGEMRYGESNGQESLLQPMCAEYELPLEWGDPATAIPFPCELVHMGCGPSCEIHALYRFSRSFRWATATYLPLMLALQLRKSRDTRGLQTAATSALRSSAFLGAFISLFYYGVCLARTRLGPYVIGKDANSRMAIDKGICVGTGCSLCGWSILIEQTSRQKDIALFVAPRALATLLPRRYAMANQWRETLAFSLSTAVVFTAVMERKESVRGVLGKLLGTVLEH